MKQWSKRFWYEHGDRLVYVGLAFVMCLFFTYNTEIPMKEQAKNILLIIVGILINKIRTPEQPKNKEDKV